MRRNSMLPASLIVSIFMILVCAAGLVFGTTVSGINSGQEPLNERELFTYRVAEIWGEKNIWEPSPTVWVQYESDLGERSAVDYENGTVKVQLLVDLAEDPFGEEVLAHLRQGVSNLILGDAEDPVEMVILNEQKKEKIKEPDPKIKKNTSHDLTLGYKRPSTINKPLILDQLRGQDGRSVSVKDVDYFTTKVVTIKNLNNKKIVGKDGIKRQAVTVEFDLAPNHLEIRARSFYPMVKSSALKYDLEPSIIMGIIHTESMFNPRARSRTPAFGLMQLVPQTGAREAYAQVHGISKAPSAKLLYDPKKNIELGVAYFDILRNRYMTQIDHPDSRTYCAVAAYNAGAANVGRAFIPQKSIQKATPVINNLSPSEVYKRLVEDLHTKESRLYTQKVLTRSVLYSTWN